MMATRNFIIFSFIEKNVNLLDEDMHNIYGAKFCSLHVRVSNRAAIGLYRDRL